MLWIIFFYVPANVSGDWFHVFMVGYAVPGASVIVFFGSCMFHTLKCNSIDDYHFFLTIDLSGILFAVIGGNWMNTYLEFTCYPSLRYWNLFSGTLFGILLVWPITPWLVKHRKTNLRTVLYLIFGFWTFIWWWIKVLYIEHGMYGDVKWISLYYQVRFYLLLVAALIVRNFKYPERLFKGAFNIVGASHQLFHCMVAFCMFMMYFDFHRFYFAGHYNYCQKW
jgi:adiponectin receptor